MIEAFKLLGEISLRGGEAVQSQLENIGERAESAGGRFKLLGLAMKGSAVAIGAVVTGMSVLGGAVAKAGFEYDSMVENSTVAWTTLLGSQEKAKQMIQDIANFAAKTQFGTEQVDAMAKYFHNAGYEGQNLFNELTRIADVSGAFNITADNAKELARQMAQVDQAQVAYTEDLNILQDQGVPIYKAISDELGVNIAQVKKMASNGQITADIYNKAFNSIADSVKGSADRQSQTMTGMLSTLGDEFGMLSGQVMQGLYNATEGLLGWLTTTLGNVVSALRGGGGLKGALEAIFPKEEADKIAGTINFVKGAVQAFFAFMSGQNIKGINILTALGLSPEQVVTITRIFVGIQTTVQTYLGLVQSYFQAVGTNLSSSGFINFLKTLWSSIIAPVFGMIWNTISSVLSQIQAFWNANGAQIMVAVNNFWNFISALFKFFAPVLLFVIKTVWDSIAGVIQGAISIIEGIVQVFTAIFTGNWSMLWQGIWNIVKGIVEGVWNFINLMFMVTGLGALKSFATKGLELIAGGFRGILDAVVSAGKGIIKSVVDWVNQIISRWNTMKAFGETLWGTIKNTVINLVNDAKNGAVNAFQSLVSGAEGKINALRSTVSSVFNAIKGFMSNPVQSAKSAIGSAVDWIMAKFRGMHFDIPHIKLPHFSIKGSFSLNPPKIPSFGVTWAQKGGVLDRATLIGAGEAGKEALMPLEGRFMEPFANSVAHFLHQMQTAKATGTHAEVPLIINGKELARAIIRDIDEEMQRRANIRKRGV